MFRSNSQTSGLFQAASKNGLMDLLSYGNNNKENLGNNSNTSSNGNNSGFVSGSGLVKPVFNDEKQQEKKSEELSNQYTTPIKTNTNGNSDSANILSSSSSDDNEPRSPLTPIRQKILNSPPASSSSDEYDDEQMKVLSRSPTSPNFRNPKYKTLKHKRVRNIVSQLPSIKSMDDVVKLQEEITENRDKISTLHQQLSTAQKEKNEIEVEKIQLLEKLKQLEEKKTMAEDREKETKEQLTTMTNQLNETVENLHAEFDLKIQSMTSDRNESEKYNLQAQSLLRDQLCQLHIQNETTKKLLEKLELESTQHTQKLKEDEVVILELQKDIDNTKSNNTDLQQSLELTKESLVITKKELFFSTCLAIKLNLLMLNTPINISTQDLWEEAESQQISSSRFSSFINQKIKLSPMTVPTIDIPTTTTTTTTTTTSSSKSKSKKK